MLKIEGLSVSYGKRRVLQAVSLDVQPGQVLALIGPNGAGKSTLVRAVSGVIPVQAGKVGANGDDLLSLPPMRRALYLAVVPQVVSLPPAFTVWETVLMGRTPYLNFLGQISEMDGQIARQALQKVDALDLAERRVGEHLDLQHQVSLMETVRSLAHTDALAVLVALHDLNLAARYADRVVLLVGGEVKAAGTPRQVLTPELISMAYHLAVRVVPHPFADVPWVLPEGK